MEDENVRFDHFSQFWYALGDLGVVRRARLMQVGHVDPFDVNRADWVDELHRWFDYWLQGVPNGILDGPQVEVETSPGHFDAFASWPVPGSTPTQLFLRPGANAGTLGLAPSTGSEPTTSFTDLANQSETTMLNNPTTVTANKRVFLSAPLTAPLHISGTPVVQLDAQVNNKTGAHFGAALVDYGAAFPRVTDNINNNGVQTLTTSDCWGESSTADSACYKDVGELINTNSTAWRVSKGVLDAGHRDSLTTPTPIVAGQRYPFSFQMLPEDYTFGAGHQIGVVIVGSYRDYSTTADTTPAAQITLGLRNSRISLPIVGGSAAATAAGFAAGGAPTATTVTQSGAALTATVASTDPATTAAPLPGYQAEFLTKAMYNGFTTQGTPTGKVQFLDGGQNLGAPVALAGGKATITPALSGGSYQISAVYQPEGAYDASASAEISDVVPVTGGASGTVPATLSLTLGAPAQFGAFTPGVARTYSASTTANVISTAGDAALSWTTPTLTNGAFSLASPVVVEPAKAAWSAPASNDAFTIAFRQVIGAGDALRTGTYSAAVTFTLSTTTP